MSVRMEQTAERAHRLVETGEVAAAQAMLHEALAAVEPDPKHASPSLAVAAMLYARVLVTLGEPGTARRWAAYAHTASRRLYGAEDERTLQAASVLAGVLYRAGAYSRSAHIYRELIDHLAAGDGARSARVMAAQADLATVLHARGDCLRARDLLARTWSMYRYRYGEDHPVGIRMLARLGGMERSCGLPERARERFALAETLCRRYLPPGHRLTAQVGLTSRLEPDRRHICGEPLGWAGDGRPEVDAAQAEAGTATGAPPAEKAPPGTEALLRAETRLATEAPATTEVAPRHVPAVPSTRSTTTDLERYRRARRRQQVKLGVMAGMAVMIITVVTIAAGVLIARARSTSDGLPAGAAGNAAPSAAGNAGPSAAGNPPPSAGPAASGNPPASGPPPAAPRASGPPAAGPVATGPAPRAPGPPTGVKLADSGGSLTLTWVYPSGANGQVVLTAGRPGQPRRTFQTLPAGTSRFTVYSLAADTNYCFAIGVAYSATDIKTAPPVCTAR
jgi:hypothetical protein